jgi:2,5-diamino-6-(ribosylamino)-4(3H)-pyrimidinone 5'-phosphate reductase
VTRPRVICHMLASLDGRIVTDGWPLSAEGRKEYELVHDTYKPDGWLCGRVTMQLHFASGVRHDTEVAREYSGPPRDDFVAPGEHESFAFVVDPRGKLRWEKNEIDGDHVVAICNERVSDEYLSTLRDHGVSYVLAGSREAAASMGACCARESSTR